MGIGLFLKKAVTLARLKIFHVLQIFRASPIEHLRTMREIPQHQTPAGIDPITSVVLKEHEALVTPLKRWNTVGGTKVTTPLTKNSSPHQATHPQTLRH
jgi:hypothetical protein